MHDCNRDRDAIHFGTDCNDSIAAELRDYLKTTT